MDVAMYMAERWTHSGGLVELMTVMFYCSVDCAGLKVK